MNLKEKKELLNKIRSKMKWAIPIALIQFIIIIPLENLLFISLILSGIVDTELQKMFIYTLMGCISTYTTEKIIFNAKQKYNEYEKETIDICLTKIKTEKVEYNVKRLTSRQKIELLSMIKNNQEIAKIVSELEDLKNDGEEEFYNTIIELLKENEEKYEQKNSIPPKKHHNNSSTRNHRRTRKI